MLTLNSSQSVKHTLFGNIYAVIQQQKRVQQTTALIPVASDLLTGLLLPTIGEAKDATRTAMTSYRSIVMCIAVVMVVAVALTGQVVQDLSLQYVAYVSLLVPTRSVGCTCRHHTCRWESCRGLCAIQGGCFNQQPAGHAPDKQATDRLT
jgi:hypothetical protein